VRRVSRGAAVQSCGAANRRARAHTIVGRKFGAAFRPLFSHLFGVRRTVAGDPPRRGSPVEVGRGRSLVQLPGAAGFRDLLPFEVEALLALAAVGEVRFTCSFAPAIGATRARALPTFRLEPADC
jgi:hypothetical protein